MTVEELVAATRTLVRRTLGAEVSTDSPELVYGYDGAPSLVVRCRVRALPGGKSTVIAKRSNLQAGHLRTEWASLRFLARVYGLAELVPAALAADLDHDIVVLEDCGDLAATRLGRILGGDDSAQARSALLAFQEALARLHGATAGLESDWESEMKRANAAFPSRHRVHRLVESVGTLPDKFARAGVASSAAMKQELAAVLRTLVEPGPWLVFTHGDATPANMSFDRGAVRLFDFETGGFRHALVDGSFAAIRWLHSIWAQGIPATFRDELERCYRKELARYMPMALEPAFETSLVACSIAWLGGLLELPEDGDRKWGAVTLRDRALAGLSAVAQRTKQGGAFPAIGEAALTAHEFWAKHWQRPDAIPIYPALRA